MTPHPKYGNSTYRRSFHFVDCFLDLDDEKNAKRRGWRRWKYFQCREIQSPAFDKDAGEKVTFKDVAGLSEAKEEVRK